MGINSVEITIQEASALPTLCLYKDTLHLDFQKTGSDLVFPTMEVKLCCIWERYGMISSLLKEF